MYNIFNPEHDLALGNFSPNFTPPASILKMQTDLSVLPVWYSEGSKVVVDNLYNQYEDDFLFLENIKKLLPIDSELVSFDSLVNINNLNSNEGFKDNGDFKDRGEEIVPWGWNPLLRKKLITLGVSEDVLPSIPELEVLRGYSNRINAVEVLKEFIIEDVGLGGESHYFTILEDLLLYLEHVPGNKVLKMPISGSGRGIIWILGDITDKQLDWCKRVMRNQGGVVAEPVMNKVLDFAMEFYLQSGRVEFIGYSLFKTTSSGAYSGNYLLSERVIEKHISSFISIEKLHKVRKSLKSKLSERFSRYNGPIGVDMMVCDVKSRFNTFRLYPCVEINMRMNMGLVSHVFYNRFVDKDSEGYYSVEYFKESGAALAFHEKMQREKPLKIDCGKIVSGYLALTPVTQFTHYTAFAVLDEKPVDIMLS